jgi:hypothetical protein
MGVDNLNVLLRPLIISENSDLKVTLPNSPGTQSIHTEVFREFFKFFLRNFVMGPILGHGSLFSHHLHFVSHKFIVALVTVAAT